VLNLLNKNQETSNNLNVPFKNIMDWTKCWPNWHRNGTAQRL